MSDLSELFARDPLKLTDSDIDAIIERMRLAQSNYELGAPKASKELKTPKAMKDLGDLGLT